MENSLTPLIPRLRALFARRRPEPCLHPHLIFDTYKEVILATCCRCGELWISDEAGSILVDGRRVAGLVDNTASEPALRP